ncbi:MAG: SURF1 family protein [Sphingomicrobium sp.]
MIRRLPIIPTIIVLAAVAVMVALGFWQIRRAHEKEALLARYSAARNLPQIGFPTIPLSDAAVPLFRTARGQCLHVAGTRTRAGTNMAGETGFVFIADCTTGAEGPGMSVEMGWTKNPQARPSWSGGQVEGIIAPDSKSRLRLVSNTGLGGLERSSPPSIETIPNNHRSYAVQWFLFAAIALIIYGLAARAKMKPPEPPR